MGSYCRSVILHPQPHTDVRRLAKFDSIYVLSYARYVPTANSISTPTAIRSSNLDATPIAVHCNKPKLEVVVVDWAKTVGQGETEGSGRGLERVRQTGEEADLEC